MTRKFVASLLAVVLLTALAPITGAFATIATATGDVAYISPPPSVAFGALQANDVMQVFNEKQNVTLSGTVFVDINAPGTYDAPTDLAGSAFIPQFTVVNSHFVHVDPVGSTTIRPVATLTFAEKILGVITRDARLSATDGLGAPGTLYPTGFTGRGVEFNVSQNEFVLLPDMHTIEIHLQGSVLADQIRILTEANRAPVVSAGGPYGGVEGSTVALSGSATDPDGDAVSVSWAISYTGDAGVSCSIAGAGTLTPSVTCTDDAMVTATLTASDGKAAPVSSAVTFPVGNVAPTAGALTVPVGALPLGTPAAVSASFADAGTNDTHTADINWGDASSSAASVSESGGSGTASGTHTYAAAGVYTVTMTVEDDDGGATTTSGTVVVNGPPTADASGPYSGGEGTPIGLTSAAVNDPEGDPLSLSWSFVKTSAPPATCTPTGVTTIAPTVTCDDDATLEATLSVSDGVNPPVVSQTTVTAVNEAPVLGAPSVTAGPVAVGAPVNLTAGFTDAGTADTHTATVNWGDGTSAATVVESGGSGFATGSHTYAAPGIYTITLTLQDDDGGVDSLTTSVTVNTPPTADAGGPYMGTEGDVLGLLGTAGDVDGDALTISWSFAYAGDPGISCTTTGTSTLTPTITCNDDTVITATLTVSDGVNAPVTSVTTLTVGNATPTVDPATPSSPLVPVSSTVSVSTTFADAGTNDTHSATVDWGDATVNTVPVTEVSGTGAVSDSHIYGASGTYTVTVTITDDDGASASTTTTITVNGAPVPGAGGPYTGVEGAAVSLSGNYTDPDGDPVTASWAFSVVTADVGTTCTPAGAGTFTPTLTCDDDAIVDATLTVSDGINTPVSETTQVYVNNAAPVLGAIAATPNPTPEDSPVSITAPFVDPGVNDTHTSLIDWGDATTTIGTMTESGGSGNVTGTHTYSGPGTYSVEVTVTDKDGGVSTTTVTIVVNGAASSAAGGPYSGTEGSPVLLAGVAADPEGDPLAVSWSFTPGPADAGTACTYLNTTTLTPVVTCNDDVVVTATLSVSDGINAPATSTTTITVANVAPAVGTVTVPITPVPVGSSVTISSTFTDDGANDTHTASVAWADTTSSAASVNQPADTLSASHTYTAAGTYAVTVTVTDDDGGSGSATATAYIVVYDPSAGFVTGGGWISSPSGAYTPQDAGDADAVGRANFGFVSKYLPNQTVPSGSTEFQLQSAGFNFKSTGYSWLVVTDTNTKAYYRGTGRVNGVDGYDVLVSVIDGRNTGADRFRIKVWNATSGTVAYDVQYGAADADSATLAISNGSIMIHT